MGYLFDERIADRYRHRVRLMGENISYASGYNIAKIQQVAKEIVDDWMSSPGGRESWTPDPRLAGGSLGPSALGSGHAGTRRPKLFTLETS